MVGSFPACRALAASGHAAAPLSSVMNSRRFIRQPRWQAVGDVRAYRRIARLAAAGVLHCGISTRLMTASGQSENSRQRDSTAGLPSIADICGDCRHGR